MSQHGGRAFYVGGFVRDMLMRGGTIAPKDVDVEVHGIRPGELEKLLGELGEVKKMGISFGVFNLRHYDIDIAMPRMEHATGRGHRDFEVFVDPFIGPEKAAKRRDFTVNALMQDVLTGEILDFFGGREDLERGILRHVDDGSFAEDPLRVFRAAQFAARFGFDIAGETLILCSRMDVTALSSERVFGEAEKAFLKAERPFDFFVWLWRMNRLDEWFPEISRLFCEQGWFGGRMDAVSTAVAMAKAASDNAFRGGSINVLDSAPDIASGSVLDGSDGAGFVFAALNACVGGGGRATWLRRISGNKKLVSYTENISRTALKLVNFEGSDGFCAADAPKKVRTDGETALFSDAAPAGSLTDSETADLLKIYDDAISPSDAYELAEILTECKMDAEDRNVCGEGKEIAGSVRAGKLSEKCAAALDLYIERTAKPAPTGQELIVRGFSPGPKLGEAVKYGEYLRLMGYEKDEALAMIARAFGDGE